MSKVARPLSPHIGIYRKQITSVLSILHRLTGLALYAGSLLLVALIVVVAYSPTDYEVLHDAIVSPLGRTLLFGWTFSFFYHLMNGIRHLYWDAGRGFEMSSVTRSGWLVVVLSFLLTIASWVVAYHNTGVWLYE